MVSVNSVKTGGLRKVTGSHVHCKSGNVLETLHARDTATDHYEELIDGLSHSAIYLVQAFSSVILRTIVQQLRRFQLTYSDAAVSL